MKDPYSVGERIPNSLELEDIERLRRYVDQLHRSLMEHHQRNRACEHIAIRPPHLPCPHPACYHLPAG